MSIIYNQETAVERRYPKNYFTANQSSNFIADQESVIQESPAVNNVSIAIDRGDDSNGTFQEVATQKFIATYLQVSVNKVYAAAAAQQYHYCNLKGLQLSRVEIAVDATATSKEVNVTIYLPNYIVDIGDIFEVAIGGSASGSGRSHYILGGYLV